MKQVKAIDSSGTEQLNHMVEAFDKYLDQWTTPEEEESQLNMIAVIKFSSDVLLDGGATLL